MSVLLVNANSALGFPLASNSIHTCVTSPPYYGLRNYEVEGQIGLEKTPADFVAAIVKTAAEIWRVLRDDGTFWLNLGDSYAGSGGAGGDYNKGGRREGQPKWKSKLDMSKTNLKPKDLIGIPWRTALALQEWGWILRSEIIWHKPSAMPEGGAVDRPSRNHEHIFLFAKQPKYYFDMSAIREEAAYDGRKDTMAKAVPKYDGSDQEGFAGRPHERWPNKTADGKPARNKRTVWSVQPKPYRGAHFATFPTELVDPCIRAGAPEGGVVLDPFCGSGTTLLAARNANRQAIGLDLSFFYLHSLAKQRVGMF